MPYILKERRRIYIEEINLLGGRMRETGATEGDLNFIITKLIKIWLGSKPNYMNYNSVLGILTAIQHELYRRKIAPYEDEKIKENDDVYD